MISDEIINQQMQSEDGWENRGTHYLKILEDDDMLVMIQKSKNDRPRRIMVAKHYKRPEPQKNDNTGVIIRSIYEDIIK